jgi:hypothetical protein
LCAGVLVDLLVEVDVDFPPQAASVRLAAIAPSSVSMAVSDVRLIGFTPVISGLERPT